MPAAKSLLDHCRERSFRSRRHHALLLGPAVPWPELAALQGRYAAAEHELERRAIGVQFERAIPSAVPEPSAGEAESLLAEILNMPPAPYNPVRDHREAEREMRTQLADWRRQDGWTLAAIAAELDVSPATIRRDLAASAARRRLPAEIG
jgi:hypothetical protein